MNAAASLADNSLTNAQFDGMTKCEQITTFLLFSQQPHITILVKMINITYSQLNKLINLLIFSYQLNSGRYLYLYKYEMSVCLFVCLSVHVFLGHFKNYWETLWHQAAFSF